MLEKSKKYLLKTQDSAFIVLVLTNQQEKNPNIFQI